MDKKAGDKLQVRPFAEGDRAAVIALWQRAGLTRAWNDPSADIDMAEAQDCAALLVAETNPKKTIAGTVMVGQDGHRGWLYYLASDPDQQRRGIARQLVAAAEDWLKARGLRKVQLMIRPEKSGGEVLLRPPGL